jgi:hypothetical protein
MRTQPPRTVTALLAATAVTVAVVIPASAANTVSQTVNAGTRSASIADASLSAVSYSHAAQTSGGTLLLTADDSSGSGAGWNVTVQSSNFLYSGSMGGTDIPAANFVVTSAGTATSTAGDAVDAVGGPNVPSTLTTPASLDVARKILKADADFGEGTYTQSLGASLSIPGGARVGTYTGTLTVTISAGP